MSDPSPLRVAVAGGGIAGLSAAFFISELADRRGLDAEVTVLEKDGRPGGKLHTHEQDGFRIENGPNGFLSNEPATLQMVSDLALGEELVTASETAGRRFIHQGGRLHEVRGPRSLATTRLLTLVDKLSILFEPFRGPTPGEDPTVAEFVLNRMGPNFLSNLIEPMVAGVYAGDPQQMSIRATFPKLLRLEREHGGLLKGAFARASSDDGDSSSGGPTGPGGTLTSFERGMGQLGEAVRDYLGDSLETGCEVTALEPAEDGWKVTCESEGEQRRMECDELILATGPGVTADLMEEHSPDSAAALSDVPQPPVAVVALGFAKSAFERRLDGFGALTTRESEARCLGSLWSSTIFPGRAPEGSHLVRNIYGGARDPQVCELDDEELAGLALDDLEELTGARPEELQLSRVIRHERGIPQYTVGHPNRLETLERECRRLGHLHLTGWTYYGVAVNKIIRRGSELAREILPETD